MINIQRALISVANKASIVPFAQELAALGIEILSTDGTAQVLRDAGLSVSDVGHYTGFPEILDGRVKTLHPKIHGGLLAQRDCALHQQQMQHHDIANIDLLCVNLYPFEATVAKAHVSIDEALANIDIGGPAMLRAAAKNHQYVAAVTDSADYQGLIAELKAHTGGLSFATCRRLAQKAFAHTAAYDGAIANYLNALTADGEKLVFPEVLNVQFNKAQDLRYGENPHQAAAFYRDLDPAPGALAHYQQRQGKALSYNNIVDADAAWEMVKSFVEPACVIVKHANPCGVAVATELLHAYRQAFATDPSAAFGGIIAFNRVVDVVTMCALLEQFAEVIVAPGFSDEAMEALAQKKNVRALEISLAEGANRFEIKRVGGGVLVQTPDNAVLNQQAINVVSRRQPTPQQWQDMLFAWQVVRFVKSNAIVFAAQGRTLGIGAGQMSRVGATLLAAQKAADSKQELTKSVVASDAFFPFRDAIDVIAEHGVDAIIQPGGSIRDAEVIAAADSYGMVMAMTGVRHFRH